MTISKIKDLVPAPEPGMNCTTVSLYKRINPQSGGGFNNTLNPELVYVDASSATESYKNKGYTFKMEDAAGNALSGWLEMDYDTLSSLNEWSCVTPEVAQIGVYSGSTRKGTIGLGSLSNTSHGNKLCSVGLFSDAHFGNSNSAYAADLSSAKQVFSSNGCDIVCSTGDIVETSESELTAFVSAFGSDRLIACEGNHDAWAISDTAWKNKILGLAGEGTTPLSGGSSVVVADGFLSITIENKTSASITLEGTIAFVLANPDKEGNYYGWNGAYNTISVALSNQNIIIESGEARTFVIDGSDIIGRNVVTKDAAISYGKAGNVLLYVPANTGANTLDSHNSDIVLADEFSTSVVFASQGSYTITTGNAVAITKNTNDGTTNAKDSLSYYTRIHGDLFVVLSPVLTTTSGAADTKTHVILSPSDVELLQGYITNEYLNLHGITRNSLNNDKGNGVMHDFLNYRFYRTSDLVALAELLKQNKSERVFIFSHFYLPHKAGNNNPARVGHYAHSVHSDALAYRTPINGVATNIEKNGSNPDNLGAIIPYNGGTTWDKTDALCGIQLHFINNLINDNPNTVWFSGHSHQSWDTQKDDPYVNVCGCDFAMNHPNPAMATTQNDSEGITIQNYNANIYMRVNNEKIKTGCGFAVHLPSLTRPIDLVSASPHDKYASAECAVLDFYDNEVVMKAYVLKQESSSSYSPKLSLLGTHRLLHDDTIGSESSPQNVIGHGITETEYYNFETGELTPNSAPAGWTKEIPGVNGMPCYVIQAHVASRSTIGEIPPSAWSLPSALVIDGNGAGPVGPAATSFLLVVSPDTVQTGNDGKTTTSFNIQCAGYQYTQGETPTSIEASDDTYVQLICKTNGTEYSAKGGANISRPIGANVNLEYLKAELYVNGVKVQEKGVNIVKAGLTGRIPYPMGLYDKDTTYTATDQVAPYVMIQSGSTIQRYVMNKTTSVRGLNPSTDYAQNGNDATWILMTDMRAIYAEIAMIELGLIGKAVFWNQFMFSQYGTDKNGNLVQSYGVPTAADDNANFIPNILLDFLTGAGHLAGGKLSWDAAGGLTVHGNISNPFTRITNSNLSQYATVYSDRASIDLSKVNYSVQFECNTCPNNTIHLPNANEKELGCEFTILNVSGVVIKVQNVFYGIQSGYVQTSYVNVENLMMVKFKLVEFPYDDVLLKYWIVIGHDTIGRAFNGGLPAR